MMYRRHDLRVVSGRNLQCFRPYRPSLGISTENADFQPVQRRHAYLALARSSEANMRAFLGAKPPWSLLKYIQTRFAPLS